MADPNSLYLGLDLSTQQMKAILVDRDLQVHLVERVIYDSDLCYYRTTKGVLVNEEAGEVVAPIAMWLEALDLLMTRIAKASGNAVRRIKAVGGAAQQHGSVFWSQSAQAMLSSLDENLELKDQLYPGAFSHPFSPNWQDHSTEEECRAFEAVAGGPECLADQTGSKAHHRFTGPQIAKLSRKQPTVYQATSHITLISNFLASIFIGNIADVDISDACGMNLWNIRRQEWDERLCRLTAPDGSLPSKLGNVRGGREMLGCISPYWVKRFGFQSNCQVFTFTGIRAFLPDENTLIQALKGDNPATMLALPLHPLDIIVSLGTSTTVLLSSPTYEPSPAYHVFAHPTNEGMYMVMLCYKNGSLVREEIKDSLNAQDIASWNDFDEAILSTKPLLRDEPGMNARLGYYFRLPEIIPDAKAGYHRFEISSDGALRPAKWEAHLDARAAIESQALSIRLRLSSMLPTGANGQPRRIYIVGGGSNNTTITHVFADILGGQGVFTLDVSNACLRGAAYKALWASEGAGLNFDSFMDQLWQEDLHIRKVAPGYRKNVWEGYGQILDTYARGEELLSRS